MKHFLFLFCLFVSLPYLFSRDTTLLNFTIENDSFAMFVDRYYTSGLKVEYQQDNLFSPVSYLSKIILFAYGRNCFQELSCKKYLNSYSFSHIIFTPDHYKAQEPASKDRAYAGLAYLTNTNTFYFDKFILNNQISFGNLGPSSQGKAVQENFHKLFTFYTPKGWSHEIHDRTIYHWDFLNIIPFSKNFALPLGFRLGNWNQNINLGFQFRFGQIVSKNTFAVHSLQHSETNAYYEEDEEEFYFFIQPRIFYEPLNWSHGEQNQIELDYRGILDDRRYTKMQRYFLLNYGLLKAQNYEDSINNFLIFNTLFNGTEGFSQIEGRIFLEYARKKNYDFKDFGVWLGAYNIVRYQDQALYSLARYLSFRKLLNQLEISPQTQETLFTILYLQGEFNRTKPFNSQMKNLHGNLQFGVVYKAKNIFVNFAWTFSTLDFEVQKSLPNYHAWGRIQLGVYF